MIRPQEFIRPRHYLPIWAYVNSVVRAVRIDYVVEVVTGQN